MAATPERMVKTIRLPKPCPGCGSTSFDFLCDACRGEAFAIEVCAGKLRVTCLRCKRVFQIEAMN